MRASQVASTIRQHGAGLMLFAVMHLLTRCFTMELPSNLGTSRGERPRAIYRNKLVVSFRTRRRHTLAG